MKRFISFSLILLLLAGCSTTNSVGNKILGNVKLYEGTPLPDSEISVLRGISSGYEQQEKAAQYEGCDIEYYMSNTTAKVDGKYADGEAIPNYLNYSWEDEKRRPPFDEPGKNVDYHLKPGVHTILTYIGHNAWINYGGSYGPSKFVSTKHSITYDFKKGCRYRIGGHFTTIKIIMKAVQPQILYTYTVWLQQINADGSVIDVAQFKKIGSDYSG